MKYLIIISFIFCAFLAKAQHASSPSIKQPYWVDYGFVQNDSGFIPAIRDTLWTPRKRGTQVRWEHAGVDSAIWSFTGTRWIKGVSAIQINDVNHLQDSLDSKWLRVGSDIFNNNSSNVIVGTPAGGSYTEKVQDYGSLRVRTGTNQNFVVNSALGISYLTDANTIANATFTMGAISMPFSKIGIGETVTGNFTDPSLAITRTAINTASTVLNIARVTGNVTQSNIIGASVNDIVSNGTINQTGTSNGVTRGLWIDKTLTAAADWRAIEVTRGQIYFGTNYVNTSNGDSALSTSTTGKVQNKIIHDHITAGTNITVSGSGTTPDPYVITGTGGGGGSGINSVVGTANRITITGTTDLVVNVSPAYAGDATIVTTGIITTGGYQATPIADAYIASQATWNAKESALTFSSPLVRSTNTISIPDAAADGTTKGAATFAAADFDATAGLIKVDYVNGRVGTSSLNGYISSTDWTTFNNKQAAITGGATTITSSNLTASKALVSDGSGKVAVSTATATDLTNLPLQYTSQALSDGATITFNCNSGYVGTVTLGGNRTLSITNATAWHTIRLKLTQDGTGSRTITLPANSKVPLGFGSGTGINLSTTAGAIDWLYADYDGTNYWWTIVKNDQ